MHLHTDVCRSLWPAIVCFGNPVRVKAPAKPQAYSSRGLSLDQGVTAHSNSSMSASRAVLKRYLWVTSALQLVVQTIADPVVLFEHALTIKPRYKWLEPVFFSLSWPAQPPLAAKRSLHKERSSYFSLDLAPVKSNNFRVSITSSKSSAISNSFPFINIVQLRVNDANSAYDLL